MRRHRLLAIGCATVLVTGALGGAAYATGVGPGQGDSAAPSPAASAIKHASPSTGSTSTAMPEARATTTKAMAMAMAKAKATATAAPSPSPSPSPSVTTRVPSAQTVLSAAARPVIDDGPGQAGIAVLDLTTGASGSYDGGRRFQTASIVKVDILATLLLRHDKDGTEISGSERSLATAMIEHSDNDAASDLYDDDGQAAGIDEANKSFDLTDTQVGTDGYWGLTETTASDQIRLLENVFTAHSALTPADRRYIQGLMSKVESDQRWGVSAAASAGTSFMLKNGWLPNTDTGLWSINSIGEVQHDGRTYLVAALSDDEPDEGTGISHVEKLAASAVRALSDAHY